MTFIAILVALIIERFIHWSHLRQWQWFTRYQQFLSIRFPNWPKLLLLSVGVIPLIAIVSILNNIVAHEWHHIPELFFDVFILVYCLGPQNLWVQIYSCIRALNKEDTGKAIEQVNTAFELGSIDQPQAFHQAFTRSIFVAANQRIFTVLFWFALLGPLGAILYRSVSLCVTNAAFGVSEVALQIQQALDWLPSRIFTFIFALGGNFNKVFSVWKKHAGDDLTSNEKLLGECGIAALDIVKGEYLVEDGSAENEALALLDRVLIIGLVILAILVLVV